MRRILIAGGTLSGDGQDAEKEQSKLYYNRL